MRAAKKIVLLTHDFPPLAGGISRYLYELIRHLPYTSLTVYGIPGAGMEVFDEQQPFRIVRVPAISSSWSKSLILVLSYLRHLALSPGIDVILCGQAHYSITLPAWIASRMRKVPYVVFVYGMELHGAKEGRVSLTRWLLRCADKVIAISDATSNIVNKIGVPSDRIRIVRPPVTVEKLQTDVSKDELIERFSLQGKRVILTVGRLVERKGHDTVIEALTILKQEFSHIHYLIVGTGPHEAKLRELTIKLHLQDYVSFAGFVPDAELASYYELCDVFVMISREIPATGDMEGFGIVYLEANLFNKPVVGGITGGVTDAIVDGVTGLLVPFDDPPAVASATARIIRDPSLALKLGSQGKERAIADFSGVKAAQDLLQAISELMQ